VKNDLGKKYESALGKPRSRELQLRWYVSGKGRVYDFFTNKKT
jgi:hypothetical protein